MKSKYSVIRHETLYHNKDNQILKDIYNFSTNYQIIDINLVNS